MTELNPYVAPTADLDHEFDIDDVELAGLGERFVARLIDWTLRCIIYAVLFIVFFPALTGWFNSAWGEDWFERTANNPYEIMWHTFINFNFPLILYLIALTHISFLLLQGIPLAIWGQTLGKKWMNIAMVDPVSFEKVPFHRLFFLRYLVWDVPALFFGPLNWLIRLTDLCFGFQNDRRTLHDKLAKTVVIKV
ncbi:MAG: RDD family protein [Gammaproteobacteria bacterium]|nr:RDD family protein [Gammaproteobacteria bacterium]